MKTKYNITKKAIENHEKFGLITITLICLTGMVWILILVSCS